MKAFAIASKGVAPAVLEIPDPVIGPGDVRIRVDAASVNGFDLAVVAGHVWDVMPHTFPVVLGRDFVGTVDEVGDDVTQLHAGDRVAGAIVSPSLGPGAMAEYVTAAESGVTLVPEQVSVTDAAALGLAAAAGHDAIEALEISAGDTVLVAGATGGVGSIAVQLAARKGATVIATALPGEEESYVRALGAAHVVDYTGDLATAVRAVAPDGVNKALHAAGDPTPVAATVSSGGRLASMLGATADQVGRDDITVIGVVAHVTPEKLAGLLDQLADSRLRVRIAASVPYERAPDALAAFAGGTIGKVLIVH